MHINRLHARFIKMHMITLLRCIRTYLIDAYDSIYSVHMISIIGATARNKKETCGFGILKSHLQIWKIGKT